MRTARYWTRAQVTIDGIEDPNGGIAGVGWSDFSIEDARRVAVERARRSAAVLKNDQGQAQSDYPYPDRPLREPVIDRIFDGDRLTAIVTRNAYGVLVLNTTDVMFIDIDAPTRTRGWLGSLFAGAKHTGKLAQTTAAKLHELTDADPNLGFRLYQTAAGLRVLATGRAYDPVADETESLMNHLKADKQYIQLCKTQSCFRARLTPKPWRCGVTKPPVRFPYADDTQQLKFDAWLQAYESEAGAYAACKLIAHIGQKTAPEHVRPILAWHDELSCGEGLPLA